MVNNFQPENLLLDSDGNIKLCDFGWSAENSASGSRETFCGTFDYMAPEMISNKPHDYSSNKIFCIFANIKFLHGEAPFAG